MKKPLHWVWLKYNDDYLIIACKAFGLDVQRMYGGMEVYVSIPKLKSSEDGNTEGE